LEKKLPVST